MTTFSAITDNVSALQRAAASEARLVATAQDGEHTAYSELYSRYRKVVFRTVLKITRNLEDAEDVLQDSWMRGFIHLRSFDGRASFSTWITRIAINTALSMLRKRRKQKEYSLDNLARPDNPHHMQIRELSPSPEERCMEIERQRVLRQAIQRLPKQLRAAVDICESQDGSIHERAFVAGISVPAMKSRMHRARLRLREPLRQVLKERAKSTCPTSGKGSNPAQGTSRHQPILQGLGKRTGHNQLGKADSEEVRAIDGHGEEVQCVTGQQIPLDARCDMGGLHDR